MKKVRVSSLMLLCFFISSFSLMAAKNRTYTKKKRTSNTNANSQNRNYAPGMDIIGYGYNVFGEYANQKSKKRYKLFNYSNFRNELIGNTMYAIPKNVFVENISEHIVKTVSGESQREYAKNLSGSAGLSVDAFFFSASVKSSYNYSSSKRVQHFYHTYMDANTKWRVSLDTRSINKLKFMLSSSFKNDIDRMDPMTLFDTYGTHYIASAYLGGRADFTSKSEITNSSSSKDITVAVEAKYKAVSANKNMSKSQKNTLSNSKTTTKLTVTGGNSEYINDISNNTQYREWASGIAGKPVLCDFDKESLRPIWEFATTSVRKRQLEAAFKQLLARNPLPKAMASSMRVQNKIFFIKNKKNGLFWDLPGYHFNAKFKGAKVGLYKKDNGLDKGLQGIDRFIKVIPHPTEYDYVFLQPQHSEYVVELANSRLYLRKKKTNNKAQWFKLTKAENESGTYFIENGKTKQYLTTFNNDILGSKKTKSSSQKWVFENANPAQMSPPDAGYKFALQNFAGKRYIDIPGGAPTQQRKDAKLQLWNMDSQPDRFFSLHPVTGDKKYFFMKTMHSEYFVDVQGGSKNNGARLRLWDRNNSAAQQFTFVYAGEPMTFYIINKNSGKAFDADAGKINANGCKVNQWQFHGKNNQKWTIKHKSKTWHMPPKNQRFYIKTAYNNKYFDLPGDGAVTRKNGVHFKIWDFGNGGDRIFKIIPSGKHSWVNIQVQNGGKYLSIPSNSNKNRQPLILWPKTYKNDQKFAIQPTSPWTFALRTSNWKAIDVEGGKFNNGTNLIQWDAHFGRSQQFQLIYADGAKKGQPYVFFY